MSTILLNDSTMTEIADAIREKSGTTKQMLPNEMASKITLIPSGFYVYTPKSVTQKTSIASGTVFNGPGIFYINRKSNIPTDAYIIVDGIRYNIRDINANYDGLLYYWGDCIPFKNKLEIGDGFTDISASITVFNTSTKTKVNSLIPIDIINIYPDTSTSYRFSIKGKGFVSVSVDDTSAWGLTMVIDDTYTYNGSRNRGFASYFTKSIDISSISYTRCVIVLYKD